MKERARLIATQIIELLALGAVALGVWAIVLACTRAPAVTTAEAAQVLRFACLQLPEVERNTCLESLGTAEHLCRALDTHGNEEPSDKAKTP